MEFLFFIVIGVIFVVQLAVKQMRKDDSSGSSPWGSSAGTTRPSRPQAHRAPPPRPGNRPRPQASPPKSLEEALRLSDDRPAPPSMRYGGLDHDDDGPAEVRARGEATADDSSVMADAPRAEEDAPRVPEDFSDPVTSATVGTEPSGTEPSGGDEPAGIQPAGADPAGPGSAASEPAGPRRPSEPFTPAYSTSVYTPTSVYSSYTPTSLYTSGTSILDGEKPAEPGAGSDDGGAHEPDPEEDQRS